jgi:2-(1,2-epoxy-1,2-dihydrophenyl)acetyl-CoA isomerase
VSLDQRLANRCINVAIAASPSIFLSATKNYFMSSILLQIDNGIATISLNRESKLNAFTREMSLLLQDVLDECANNAAVRVLYLTGRGKAFSAGQDIAEIGDPPGSGLEKILVEQFNPIVSRIRNIGKPVVAAVNGVAAGAGANIALACDVVVAAQSASFIQAFSKIGLIPDSGGTFFLPRLIGWQKATALMMLGDKMSAEEAERCGMIYKFFQDQDFLSESMRIASSLVQLPARALSLTKRALNLSFGNSLEQQLKCEEELQCIAGGHEDFRKAISAFLAKKNK